MKLLITNEELTKRIKELGNVISNDFFGQQDIIVAPVLNGGLVFAGHLIPHLNFPLKFDYFHTSRYKDDEEGTELLFIHNPTIDLDGKIILLVDDIYDSGITLDTIESYCYEQGAKLVIKIVLLNKQKAIETPPKYVGFNIPDHFVYGFGLDRKGFYRNLDSIYYDEKGLNS
jgi:hypoxanthine phosphoribosyltransferase